MADSYFACLEQTPTSGRYVASGATAGPWSPELQHGGPPNALAVAAAERALHAETGRADLTPVRLAADFLAPVPVAEVQTRTRVLRVARSAALAEVTVSAEGRDRLLTRVWFVRHSDTSAVAAPPQEPSPMPDAATGLDVDFGYGKSLDWRVIDGQLHEPGPGTVWARAPLPLVNEHVATGLARVALIADSASGISAELDWSQWSFVNVDLDVHLARPFEGEWLLMAAHTQLGGHGFALARSTLSDVRGVVGAGLQTLVLARIPQ